MNKAVVGIRFGISLAAREQDVLEKMCQAFAPVGVLVMPCSDNQRSSRRTGCRIGNEQHAKLVRQGHIAILMGVILAFYDLADGCQLLIKERRRNLLLCKKHLRRQQTDGTYDQAS